MNILVLEALSERLSNDADLNLFFLTAYSKPCKHVIGYKRSTNANDFPSICYVPVKQIIDGSDNKLAISIVLGINDPLFDGAVFNGVRQSAEIVRLVRLALLPLDFPSAEFSLSGKLAVIGDLGTRHPFYETELQLTADFLHKTSVHNR